MYAHATFYDMNFFLVMIVNDAMVNLIILPHLLSDARIKADYEKVIYFTKVCSE